MKLQLSTPVLLYCKACVSDRMFREEEGQLVDDLGHSIHPVQLWACYSTDDETDPPTLVLPLQRRSFADQVAAHRTPPREDPRLKHAGLRDKDREILNDR